MQTFHSFKHLHLRHNFPIGGNQLRTDRFPQRSGDINVDLFHTRGDSKVKLMVAPAEHPDPVIRPDSLSRIRRIHRYGMSLRIDLKGKQIAPIRFQQVGFLRFGNGKTSQVGTGGVPETDLKIQWEFRNFHRIETNRVDSGGGAILKKPETSAEAAFVILFLSGCRNVNRAQFFEIDRHNGEVA